MMSRNGNVYFSYQAIFAKFFREVIHLVGTKSILRFIEPGKYCQLNLTFGDIHGYTFKNDSKIGCAFVEGFDLINLSDLNLLH